MMTSWRKLIIEAMERYNESWQDVVSHTFRDDSLIREFDDGFGGTEGVPFTVWTRNRVYFPVCYDGSEWVESVSRNPDGNPTYHLGGG